MSRSYFDPLLPRPHGLLIICRIAFIFLLSIGLVACSKPQVDSKPSDALSIHLLTGDKMTLSDYEGRWLVVNYWAEWCKPCIKEIPELNALNANHGNIQVVGINYDKPQETVLMEQVAKLGIEFPTLLLNRKEPEFIEYYQIEKPRALPSTLIISPDLELKSVLLGPQDEAKLLREIQSLSEADNKAL